MSGLRATVIMEDGKVLDKEKTTKAIVGKNLALVSFGTTEKAIPEAAYVLAVSGTG